MTMGGIFRVHTLDEAEYEDGPPTKEKMVEHAKLKEEQINFEGGAWVARGSGFLPADESPLPKLPAGIYDVHPTQMGLMFHTIKDSGDDLLEWPGSVVSEVVRDIESFWSRGDRFKEIGLAHKRGMLLYGPPGSGKTSVLRAVASWFVQKDGIVFMDSDVGTVIGGLQLLRKQEPNRPALVLFEDFDAMVARGGNSILSLLDGEHQIDKVVFLATTNYPEKLPPRITNRPSRFDVLLNVGMPNADGRLEFLRRRAPNIWDTHDINRWVADTEGFSMAHIKELVVAVHVLDLPYDSALERLKKMLAGKSIVPDPQHPGQFL